METEHSLANNDRPTKEAVVSNNSFSEHGSEIEDIISKRLPLVIRWGTLFLFLLLLFIGLICWFIRYPDIISAPATLTSINAPKPVITTINGKLIRLNAKENQWVEKNQVLGFLESTANHEEVLSLSSNIDTLQNRLENNHPEVLQKEFGTVYTQLGELQSPYQVFAQALLSFKSYLTNGFYLHKKARLVIDMENLQRLHVNLLEQQNLKKQDISLSEQSFSASQRLVNEKVISTSDYNTEKSSFINKKLTLPQITNEIINNEAQQNEKQKEIEELNNTISQQKIIFLQALNTLKSEVDEWKKKYLLVASVAGRVTFATYIQENQQLQANQTICYVNPENSQYFAQIVIPQSNFGKVRVGQPVLLKFPSYPFQEYGAVKGRIEFISHISSDSGYFAKVNLTCGLHTNYNHQIQYRDGLKGQAEIITKDMRLLERFFFDILKQIKQH